MIFSSYELLTLLKTSTKLSRDDIHDKGGPHPRIQQRILNENHNYPLRNIGALARILVDQGVMPIDWSWYQPISQLRELQDKEDLSGIYSQFSAFARVIEDQFNRDLLDATKPFYLGSILFLAYYMMPFVKPKNSAYCSMCPDAYIKSITYFTIIMDCLANDSSPFAVMMKQKCAGNIVVIEWNSRSIADRASPEMRHILNKTKYFEWAFEQIELLPNDDTAAFNCACIASQLEWTEMFKYLYLALVRSNSRFMQHPEFEDDDLSAFREWVKLNYPKSTAVNTPTTSIKGDEEHVGNSENVFSFPNNPDVGRDQPR